MSIQPLILKNGVNTYPRSPTDVSALLASIGLGNVNNTSDLSKPISTATQTALDLKANLISPSLSGVPTTPTATTGTNTTQIANCAFVTTAVSAISTSSFVDLSTNQTINGVKVFSGSLQLPNNSGSTVGTIWRSGNNLEYKDGANATKILLNSAGNLSNLMDKQVALNNLVNGQVANRVLRSDGTNTTLSQVSLTTDVINTLPISLGGTGSATQNFVDLTTAQTITGVKVFSNTTQATSSTTGAVRVSAGGLSVVGNLWVGGTINQTNAHTFRAAASTSQTVPNATATKINLTSEVNDSNNQYDPTLSRLTAITTEVWRINLYITFNLASATRVIMYVYKNGAEANGGLRVLDNPTTAGFFAQTISIPEMSLIAGDYLEVFCYLTPSQAVFGSASLLETYWFGKRIN